MIAIDIEMPQSCYDCPMGDNYGAYQYCRATKEIRDYKYETSKTRMSNCPLFLLEGENKNGIS